MEPYAMTTTIEHRGFKFLIEIEHDADMGAPWMEHDGHGVVSDWKHHAFGQGTKPPKAPRERILVWDRGAYRTYDIAATIEIAKRDGWDAEPYGGSKGERAARAVEADFKRMAAWCNDEWHWCGVVVTLVDDEGNNMLEESVSLWGIESDSPEYHKEVARDLADEIISGLEAKAA